MAEESKTRREIVLINKSENQGGDRWSIVERISKVLSIAAIPVVLAVGGWYIQKQLQNQTVSRDYVQLAVSILKEPDTSKIKPELRAWAVDLLSDNSPTKFSPEVAQQLKSGETTLPASISALLTASNNRGAIAISPDGKTFIVGNEDGTASLWDIVSGARISTLQGHTDAVTSVAFLPDGRTIFTGSTDRTVGIWELATGENLGSLEQTDTVIGMSVSPDGKHVLVRTLDGEIGVWEIASFQKVRTYNITSSAR